MIEKITDQNLERYDSRLKEWCDRKFFEKGNYGKYETTEEAGIVAFYPVPNTPLEGKVKFSFKETMPAEGVKGPENPSVIEGVSSVKVMHCGKNLAYPRSELATETVSDVTYTVNSDGTYTVDGTASDNSTFYPRYSNNYTGILLKNGSTYSLSGCPSGGDTNKYFLHTNFSPSGYRYKDYGNGVSFTFNLLSKQTTNIAITVAGGYAASNLIFKPQLELGAIATEFEKPVYNEYTISLGNTYYGGTVDLSTGLMTVTWGGEFVNTFTATFDVQTNTVAFSYDSELNHDGNVSDIADRLVCNRFLSLTGTTDIERCRYAGALLEPSKAIRFYINKSHLDVSSAVNPDSPTNAEWLVAANTWLSDNTVMIAYKLFTPFTIQLSPIQISTLFQFNKYTPRLNTVYTDADSIQISYLKSPIRDEYEKTQAILSLGGNS